MALDENLVLGVREIDSFIIFKACSSPFVNGLTKTRNKWKAEKFSRDNDNDVHHICSEKNCPGAGVMGTIKTLFNNIFEELQTLKSIRPLQKILIYWNGGWRCRSKACAQLVLNATRKFSRGSETKNGFVWPRLQFIRQMAYLKN